jgi:hypothetical protein
MEDLPCAAAAPCSCPYLALPLPLATAAAQPPLLYQRRPGVPEAHIQNQTRHKSLPVLRGYIGRGSLLRDNAAAKVGL